MNPLQYCSLARNCVPLWNCSPFTEPRFWLNWSCLALTSKHISRTRSNILISDCCSCTKAQWRLIRLLKGSQWIWIIVWLSFIILVVSDTHSQFLCCNSSVFSTLHLQQISYGGSENCLSSFLQRWKYKIAATEIDLGPHSAVAGRSGGHCSCFLVYPGSQDLKYEHLNCLVRSLKKKK